MFFRCWWISPWLWTQMPQSAGKRLLRTTSLSRYFHGFSPNESVQRTTSWNRIKQQQSAWSCTQWPLGIFQKNGTSIFLSSNDLENNIRPSKLGFRSCNDKLQVPHGYPRLNCSNMNQSNSTLAKKRRSRPHLAKNVDVEAPWCKRSLVILEEVVIKPLGSCTKKTPKFGTKVSAGKPQKSCPLWWEHISSQLNEHISSHYFVPDWWSNTSTFYLFRSPYFLKDGGS